LIGYVKFSLAIWRNTIIGAHTAKVEYHLPREVESNQHGGANGFLFPRRMGPLASSGDDEPVAAACEATNGRFL
jgi:hypothetical protein